MIFRKLSNTEINASILGFGCANLMGKVGRKQSLKNLSLAMDKGINLFDTARSYGWGESEKVLGEFLIGKRSKIVLITKFGQNPPKRQRVFSYLKVIARKALRVSGKLFGKNGQEIVKKKMSNYARTFSADADFSVENAKKSLQTSLKNLNTDYIDIYFLHGPFFEQIRDGQLIKFLCKEVEKGTIRKLGVSGLVSEVNLITKKFPEVSCVQIENNLGRRNVIDVPGCLDIIGFSPLKGANEMIFSKDELRKCGFGMNKIIESGNFDVKETWLAYSFLSNKNGWVLSGMNNPDNIKKNVSLVNHLKDNGFL